MKFKVPNTYIIIFTVILISAVSTWLVPDAVPQTWQVFSALYEGFVQQSGIISFVLVIGGAFWVLNSTKALEIGIGRFVSKKNVGNFLIIPIMLLFGLFGAVFGMSEETIAFTAMMIPLAKSLGYDEFVGVAMVYIAAHVGFAGAMLNPFTIGIAQNMSDLPLFSGIEYRTFCWAVLMAITILFVLIYASKHRKKAVIGDSNFTVETHEVEKGSPLSAWIVYAAITVSLILFSIFYSESCHIKLGNLEFSASWLMWVMTALFVVISLFTLLKDRKSFILNLLFFTIVFLVVGVMGYGWYLPEICALFMAMAIAVGFAEGYSADRLTHEFIAGAKDIFSAALIIGLAAGIIVILENGNVIDIMLSSIASLLESSSKTAALGAMYGIQTFINIFIPSASAKAAVTMPIMAPFSDIIGISRQATVLAFQFGDGFTNMITPCSGVLMAILSVAKISYEQWFKWIWKFVLLLIVVGFLLLIPTVFIDMPGF